MKDGEKDEGREVGPCKAESRRHGSAWRDFLHHDLRFPFSQRLLLYEP